MNTLEWHGLYREGWGKEIVPDAFSHPAKFSRGLIRRIYDHLAEQGYLQVGDVVGDPFGGVALGALDCMRLGCHWRGMELEQKFVDLGQQNISRWLGWYRPLWPDTWGTAVLLQGDSRQFAAGMGQVAVVVSSPPYIGTAVEKTSDGVDLEKQWQTYRNQGGGAKLEAFIKQQKRHAGGYGTTPGQLGAMRTGELDAVVSSPPYEGSSVIDLPRGTQGMASGGIGTQYRLGNRPKGAAKKADGSEGESYGNSPGQLSGSDNFWAAARAIVDQCYQVLKPGGVAVWVLKRFVRNKQIVEFPGQWRQMCEAAGFETVEWIRAWLVEEHGEQLGLLGGSKTVKKERKSFFRRLYENKYPENSIDWEDVVIMRKV